MKILNSKTISLFKIRYAVVMSCMMMFVFVPNSHAESDCAEGVCAEQTIDGKKGVIKSKKRKIDKNVQRQKASKKIRNPMSLDREKEGFRNLSAKKKNQLKEMKKRW